MHLQVSKSNGRSHLSIIHGYRDPQAKKVKHKTVQCLGYLDELAKVHSDPIAHFRDAIKDMNEKAALEKQSLVIGLDPNEALTED